MARGGATLQRIDRLLAAWQYVLFVPSPAKPAEITAYFGLTRSRNAGLDDLLRQSNLTLFTAAQCCRSLGVRWRSCSQLSWQ